MDYLTSYHLQCCISVNNNVTFSKIPHTGSTTLCHPEECLKWMVKSMVPCLGLLNCLINDRILLIGSQVYQHHLICKKVIPVTDMYQVLTLILWNSF